MLCRVCKAAYIRPSRLMVSALRYAPRCVSDRGSYYHKGKALPRIAEAACTLALTYFPIDKAIVWPVKIDTNLHVILFP